MPSELATSNSWDHHLPKQEDTNLPHSLRVLTISMDARTQPQWSSWATRHLVRSCAPGLHAHAQRHGVLLAPVDVKIAHDFIPTFPHLATMSFDQALLPSLRGIQ